MATFSRQKYRQLAKGFRGRANRCIRVMAPKVEKSLQYQYIGRKQRPREMRKEWIQSLNGAVREHSISYSRFICGLNRSNVNLDRKILAQLAVQEPYSFKAILDEVKIQGQIAEQPRAKAFPIEEAFALRHILYGPQITQALAAQENNQFIGFRQKNLTEEQKRALLKE